MNSRNTHPGTNKRKPGTMAFMPKIGMVLGLLGLLLPWWVSIDGLSSEGARTLGVFIFAAIFWMTEPVPIYATSLLVILLQVFTLSSAGFFQSETGGTLPPYGSFYASLASPIIVLFLGGFSLASAAVKVGLDLNLTRWLLRPFGQAPSAILFGLMLATAMLSAFMSNTATTAMMMTVILPMVSVLDKTDPFRKALALSVPFAANLGGIATPIGTPPNAIALAALNQLGVKISFTTWMLLAVPLVVVMLLICWQVLLKLFPPQSKTVSLKLDGKFATHHAALLTYLIFGGTVLLWVTEKLHGIPSSMVAFLPVALLPALNVLQKKEIRNFPWEVLWLVAGGISLGVSLKENGVADWMLTRVSMDALGPVGAMMGFCLLGYIVANLVSNTVSASILIPLVIGFASGIQMAEADLTRNVILIGIIVSFSMTLPISTPPNAIGMSSGLIDTKDMMKAGLIVGLVGGLMLIACALFYWPLFL